MFTTVVFFVILGVLVIVHEFGHFIAAKNSGVRIERFFIGFGKKLFSVKKNGTEYGISALPLGGYVKLAGDNYDEYKGAPDEYLAQPVHKRFWIIFCGPLLNYALGFLSFWVIFFVGYPTITNKVGGVLDGYGAQAAGITVGDRITSIEGVTVKTWDDIQKTIYANRQKAELKIGILRKEKPETLTVGLKQSSQPDALGQKRSLGLIGIKPDMEETIIERYGFFESAYYGFKKTIDMTVMTYRALWLMITRQLSIRESVTGPVGMFIITSEVTKLGMIALLHWIALLSVSLGLFNLLPFPALDGGHIALLFLEKIRGRGLSRRSDDVFNRIGFGFIILIAAAVFFNDVIRYELPGKLVQVLDKATHFIKK
jgi:regulator of sigma E protease